MPTFVQIEKCYRCKGGEAAACICFRPHDMMKLNNERMKAFD